MSISWVNPSNQPGSNVFSIQDDQQAAWSKIEDKPWVHGLWQPRQKLKSSNYQSINDPTCTGIYGMIGPAIANHLLVDVIPFLHHLCLYPDSHGLNKEVTCNIFVQSQFIIKRTCNALCIIHEPKNPYLDAMIDHLCLEIHLVSSWRVAVDSYLGSGWSMDEVWLAEGNKHNLYSVSSWLMLEWIMNQETGEPNAVRKKLGRRSNKRR